MGDKTGISWTESTWNPIRGCIRVSEGCRNCYAETVAARFSDPGQPYEGLARWVDRPGGKREARWTGAVQLVEKHLDDPLRKRAPRVYFVNSMSDLFFERLATADIDKIVARMGLAQHHTFQVLTKRASRMRDYLNDPKMPRRVLAEAEKAKPSALWNGNMYQLKYWLEDGFPLPHVWWGVSAEDQAAADERVPALLNASAAVRFVSYEPALGPVNWRLLSDGRDHYDAFYGRPGPGGHPALDWIIVGGESGSGARPFHVEWARDTLAQAAPFKTAVYIKQLGSHPLLGGVGLGKAGGKWDNPEAWPEDLRVQNYPEAYHANSR